MQSRARWSLQTKIVLIIVVASLLLSGAGIFVNYRKYRRATYDHFLVSAGNLLTAAAAAIDADPLAGYLATGRVDAAYARTNAYLQALGDSTSAAGLYVFIPDADGLNYIFNSDTQFGHFLLGDHKAWDSRTTAMIPDYLAGRDIPPISITTEHGPVNIVVRPLYTSEGLFAAYLAADFLVADLRADVRAFLVESLAIAAAITLLVAAACYLYVRRQLIRPLAAMADASDCYLAGQNDVCGFATLNIHTGDELQTLATALESMSEKTDAYVHDLKQANERAETDVLTGLYNRGALQRRVDAALAAHPADTHALFMIDLDKFKQINDTYGHMVGDEALSTLAARLRAAFRAGDVVARIGGDEFSIFCPSITSVDEMRARAEALLAAWRGTVFTHEGVSFSATLSIGIALAPADGDTYQALYQAADGALYLAKEAGRDRAWVSGDGQ